MDVKDIPGASRSVKEKQDSRQRSIRSLTESVRSVKPPKSEAVAVDAGPHRDAISQTESRAQVNKLISISNVTGEATGKIRELVRSLGGIVEQAASTPEAQDRLSVLAQEGNELVNEVRRIANDTVVDGVRPLAGEEIQVEVEERFGKVLKALLPDDAREAFGLGNINFSTVDSIIQTRTAVAKAQDRLDKLQRSVAEVSDRIEGLATGLDVAFQNNEAARTSLRDVEEALRLASSTRTGIGDAPKEALASVQKIDKRALELLSS